LATRRVRPVSVPIENADPSFVTLDVQGLDAVGDLARRHAQQPCRLGLHPAGLLQRGDDALAFVQVGIVQVHLRLHRTPGSG
jgi:hypothetical protein